MFAEVTWKKTIAITTLRELDATLDEIVAEIVPALPQVVFVSRSNGDSLGIVLGAPNGSFLSFVAGSNDPPYFVSSGDSDSDGVFTYFIYPNHHTEASARSVINIEAACEAVREFVQLETGLPRNVAWCEV